MISETFQSHYNPQPPVTILEQPKPPEKEPPYLQLELLPTPTPAKPKKTINHSSASA